MKANVSDSPRARPDNKDFQDLNFYKFVIDSLPVAVLTVDSELRITSINPWVEEITGYSENEVNGRYCGEILQGGRCKSSCPLKTVLQRKNPIVRIETTIKNKWGEVIPVRMNTAGLFDERYRLVGGVEAFQDISQLKALEREKNNLISMFAHDIKSPLISIHGFALRLLKTSTSSKKAKEYLNIIIEEAGKIEFLIDDFLEFSRLQTGRLKLNFSATSLEKEFQELLGTYEPRATQQGIKLKLSSDSMLPIIDADSNRLRRAFSNLLDNAIKYSRKKGTVSIIAKENDQEVIIKIKDQGTGIDPRDLPNIFDPFHRGQGVEDREGHGVGLAAVKTIVEGQGGRVLVKSELGKGSVFTVVLPKSRKL